jgi:general nucleoside transport system permease protein
VTEPLAPQHGGEPEDIAEAPPTTVASQLALLQRAGGIATPVMTALVAFLIGGLVILATGHNPIQAYWDILKGAGLNWFAHP